MVAASKTTETEKGHRENDSTLPITSKRFYRTASEPDNNLCAVVDKCLMSTRDAAKPHHVCPPSYRKVNSIVGRNGEKSHSVTPWTKHNLVVKMEYVI